MITIIIIVAVLLVAVAAVLAFAATKPDTFRVERATTIMAPPQRIYALIDDFRAWSAWSPWEKMDPALQRTFSGPAGGPGAVYEWVGNKKVGQGRMEIVDAAPPSRLAIKLDFLKPFEAHNNVVFTLEPQGDATRLNWAMQGSMPYPAKVMSVLFSMDRMVGKDFETGLANLKAAAERPAVARS
jgi:uncharacterized protein YndB with AHSA1/START domain